MKLILIGLMMCVITVVLAIPFIAFAESLRSLPFSGCSEKEKFEYPVSKINGHPLYPCAIAWHSVCEYKGEISFCPSYASPEFWQEAKSVEPTEEVHRKLGVTCAEHEPQGGW